MKKGIGEDISYLELFFRNLLLGEKRQLRNRYMHLRFDKNLPINTENLPINQVQQELLQLLQENPMYTYAELAQRVNRTRETVRVNLKKLQELGLIKRIGANKNGWWQVHLK
ncbi:MAG: Lrp/AsnC family transcriptional regulator [Treponema sp.]|nr:Lrp/AsnC family transcriptional regulator [Treponema sp.]